MKTIGKYGIVFGLFVYDRVFDNKNGLYTAIYLNDRKQLAYCRSFFSKANFIIAPDYSIFDDIDGRENEYRLLKIRICILWFKFIPTEPIEIAAGLVWGWFGGLMLCLLGNMIGSVIILIVTRRIGTRILRLFRLEKKMQSMRFLQDREKRNRLLFIFYLVPGTPKDTMTYFVGLTDMNMVEFMILSSIARIPAIVSSTICGAYLGENNFKVAATVFIVTALLSIPGAILYKKISSRYIQNHPQTGDRSTPGAELEATQEDQEIM